MKRVPLILATALLTMGQTAPESCDPTALEAADIRPGDGGVWVGSGDAAFIPLDEVPTPPGTKPLPPLPPMDLLCMLYPGDMTQRSDYESIPGTWIIDVQDERFLGPPAPDAKYASADSANLRYSYRNPDTTADQIALTLTFEKLKMVQVAGAERDDSLEVKLEDGTRIRGEYLAVRGHPLEDPYFLSRVDAQGFKEQPLCWDPFLRFSMEHHYVGCDWCAVIGRDYLLCPGGHGCFY